MVATEASLLDQATTAPAITCPGRGQPDRLSERAQDRSATCSSRSPPTNGSRCLTTGTVAGSATAKPSPDLLDTLYTMQRRQAWLRESLVEHEAEPLPLVGSARLGDEPDAAGREMRRALNLDEGWAAGVRTWEDAVGELRRAIEHLGVMAVINGVVGNNTHRRLRVEEFRGFALTDPYAPLIFVNGADAKSAQMFTLAHELAHIWLGTEGVSGFDTLLPGVPRWRTGATGRWLNCSRPPGRSERVGWKSGGCRIPSIHWLGRSR